ncbi:hypothetical protein HNP40_001479 [Mycobacteroides chelonae]|nr:hypothetical protein [Mycobacteroides chelonae]
MGLPVRASASISPDSTKIGYLAPRNHRLYVWVQSLDSDDARCVTHLKASQAFSGQTTRAGCSTCRTPGATRTGICIG